MERPQKNNHIEDDVSKQNVSTTILHYEGIWSRNALKNKQSFNPGLGQRRSQKPCKENEEGEGDKKETQSASMILR